MTKQHATYLNSFISILLLVVKYIAYKLTSSEAIYSDALESIVNVVMTFVSLIAIRYAMAPPDDDHPYGHGKVELFSSSLESVLLIFAGSVVCLESAQGLYHGHSIEELNIGLLLTTFAGVVNLVLGLYLENLGKKLDSIALVSNGKHLVLDFYTSLVILIGLLVVKFTSISRIDSLLALLMGIHLIFAGKKLLQESLSGLLDVKDEQLIDGICSAYNEIVISGIINLHLLKVIKSGDFIHIDGHVVIPEFWTVDSAHDEVEKFSNALASKLKKGAEINLHIDPCLKKYCKVCDYDNCPIRVEEFCQRVKLNKTLITARQ